MVAVRVVVTVFEPVPALVEVVVMVADAAPERLLSWRLRAG